jgi:hypothetical protein
MQERFLLRLRLLRLPSSLFAILLVRIFSHLSDSAAIEYLIKTSPSVIDFEIQSVNPNNFDLILGTS